MLRIMAFYVESGISDEFLIAWIIIAYFLFRFCFWDILKTLKPVLVDDLNLLKKECQDDQDLIVKYKEKSQKEEGFVKKRKVKFDVDIKGSATLTQKDSSETDAGDIDLSKGTNSKNHSDSKSHTDSRDHTDSKSHIDSRDHTDSKNHSDSRNQTVASFITNLKGCDIKDNTWIESVYLHEQPHKSEQNKTDSITTDSENINSFKEYESAENYQKDDEIVINKQDKEHFPDSPAYEKGSLGEDISGSDTFDKSQIHKNIPERSRNGKYSNSTADEKYERKPVEENNMSDSNSTDNGSTSSSTRDSESTSESETARKQVKENSKTPRNTIRLDRTTEDSLSSKDYTSDLDKKILEKESKPGKAELNLQNNFEPADEKEIHENENKPGKTEQNLQNQFKSDYSKPKPSNSNHAKTLQEIKNKSEKLQQYSQNRINGHQSERNFPRVKIGATEKDSRMRTNASVMRPNEVLVRSDDSLNALFRKQNGDSSPVNGRDSLTKMLKKKRSQKSSETQDDKSIRITIEPDQELESKTLEKSPSSIPRLISPQQSKSITQQTSCYLHQDINSQTPHCHVEIALFHLFE
ncbi:uncharacterized protein NPIL_214451 [Nephila pilipes]|uniref:Uncharacterized protein n=1 Tax=Nephila pilipes TaxID=299642 RepID=A0A8X6U6V0_NEPPI|nr:uncharacterized protein NPIL_214451 [Nephila pilipes]